jgi:putative Holliday junction resolvase
MSTLALDYGTRRIGVAVSDPTDTIAQPLATLSFRGARDAVARIGDLVRKHGVTRVVLGLPVHMHGREGPEAQKVRAFGALVAEATGASVDYLDERWTTIEADRALLAGGLRGRRKLERRDRVAAALLLRTYLERERHRGTEPG